MSQTLCIIKDSCAYKWSVGVGVRLCVRTSLIHPHPQHHYYILIFDVYTCSEYINTGLTCSRFPAALILLTGCMVRLWACTSSSYTPSHHTRPSTVVYGRCFSTWVIKVQNLLQVADLFLGWASILSCFQSAESINVIRVTCLENFLRCWHHLPTTHFSLKFGKIYLSTQSLGPKSISHQWWMSSTRIFFVSYRINTGKLQSCCVILILPSNSILWIARRVRQ
jgi:hypothetical protein